MVFLSGYDIGYKPLNDAIQVKETMEGEAEGSNTKEETNSNRLII